MYALVCSRTGMWEASDRERAGKRGSHKSQKNADGICTMAVSDSLILTGYTTTVHLHFVCPNTHFKLLHTLKIHQTRRQFILSLLSTHTQNWDRLHTRVTDVYVIPKTLMRHFLSAKSQVFRELGVSLKVLTSLRCLFPPQSRWLRSERGSTMQGSAERM